MRPFEKIITLIKSRGRVRPSLAAPLRRSGAQRGQSFLELALVIPILIIILLGLVEVVFFIGRYLDMIDLTREAARFASVRDPFESVSASDMDCSTPDNFNFYYDTACIFSPQESAPICTAACAAAGTDPEAALQCQYCNGLNSYFNLDINRDDVVISLYTVDAANQITDTHPKPAAGGSTLTFSDGTHSYYWALSDQNPNSTKRGNWKKDCEGNEVRELPEFYEQKMQGEIVSSAPGSKGFVVVEAYYCYDQVLRLADFIANPVRIHAYTIMPLPAAQPTATPKSP